VRWEKKRMQMRCLCSPHISPFVAFPAFIPPNQNQPRIHPLSHHFIFIFPFPLLHSPFHPYIYTFFIFLFFFSLLFNFIIYYFPFTFYKYIYNTFFLFLRSPIYELRRVYRFLLNWYFNLCKKY